MSVHGSVESPARVDLDVSQMTSAQSIVGNASRSAWLPGWKRAFVSYPTAPAGFQALDFLWRGAVIESSCPMS
jgi:hypothetical protein